MSVTQTLTQVLMHACRVEFNSFPHPRNRKAALLGHLPEAPGSSAPLQRSIAKCALCSDSKRGGVGRRVQHKERDYPGNSPDTGPVCMAMSEITH